MDVEKRKREDDGGANIGKKAKACQDEDGVKVVVAPEDEEVEEFFAILKRIHVAVKYFRERKGGDPCTDRDLTATPWSPSFEREDFEGVKNDVESSEQNRNAGLDLNSDPGSGVSDSSC
ncbi:protein NIM1-INTERACTING 2-like [Sesamum indicum]|uniref:Protein NIM1-INTERACTING 2-like n=1 Tax=Sesamum indicum TaxID=4182 RepID=A0A6I9SMR6_SESIN|nr:protein NIM1-INTERACTING 2-like [Sesamum indicum]